jgi:hypothetical protein
VPGLALTAPCGEGRKVGKKYGSTRLAWYEHGICMEAPSTPTRWVATENPYSAQTVAITRHCRGEGGGTRLGCGLERAKLSVPIAPHLWHTYFWCLSHQRAPVVCHILSSPPPSWQLLRFEYRLLISDHGLHGMSFLFLGSHFLRLSLPPPAFPHLGPES